MDWAWLGFLALYAIGWILAAYGFLRSEHYKRQIPRRDKQGRFRR